MSWYFCDACKSSTIFNKKHSASLGNVSYSLLQCDNGNCWKQITQYNHPDCKFLSSAATTKNQKRNIREHIKKGHTDTEDVSFANANNRNSDWVEVTSKCMSNEEADYLTTDADEKKGVQTVDDAVVNVNNESRFTTQKS